MKRVLEVPADLCSVPLLLEHIRLQCQQGTVAQQLLEVLVITR